MPRLAPGEPAVRRRGPGGRVTAPPGGGRRAALDGLSVTIRHGETIGVAGRSGCGKTTWLRALMRLAHPCGGKATLGGVPLERVSRKAIGELVGYVGQNPFVFAGTIAENIAYGCDKRHRRADPPRRRDGLHPRRDHDDARRLPRPRRRARPEPLRRPAAADRPGPRLPQEPADPDPRRGDLAPWTTSASGWSRRRSTPPGPTAP